MIVHMRHTLWTGISETNVNITTSATRTHAFNNNNNIFLLRVHHCTIYFVNSDAAYSAEETINKIKLLSLPIISLL